MNYGSFGLLLLAILALNVIGSTDINNTLRGFKSLTLEEKMNVASDLPPLFPDDPTAVMFDDNETEDLKVKGQRVFVHPHAGRQERWPRRTVPMIMSDALNGNFSAS